MAIGYPPKSLTPDYQKADQIQYQSRRFNNIVFRFEKNKLVEIRD